MRIALASFFTMPFFGNIVFAYALAIGLFLVLFLSLHLVIVVVKNRLNALARKTKTNADDMLSLALQKIHPIEYAGIAFYIALQTLTFNQLLHRAIFLSFLTLMIYTAIEVGSALLTSFLHRITVKESHPANASFLINLTVIGKALLWIFGSFLVLSNAGVDITSLIAGLGIGGIAVALALQNVLSDLFSSFAIHFDKPFLVGDFIIVGDQMGVVEKIGIKTTRIRALQGEELVFANKELTDAHIQNFKKMRERRVVFSIGVLYETPQKHLQEISWLLRSIIEKQEQVRFDRAHFARFDASALTFEVVYYVLSDEYTTYMDIQQQINFAILEAFSARHISMAYPTQTVYLQPTSFPVAVFGGEPLQPR